MRWWGNRKDLNESLNVVTSPEAVFAHSASFEIPGSRRTQEVRSLYICNFSPIVSIYGKLSPLCR